MTLRLPVANLGQWSCSFDLLVNGKVYIRTWGKRLDFSVEEFDPLNSLGFPAARFRFWQEVRPSAVSTPGSVARLISDLIVDDNMFPLEYKIFAQGGLTRFEFLEGEFVVSLPHGEQLTEQLVHRSHLLSGNMPPQLELLIRTFLVKGATEHLGYLFLPEAMTEIPYEIARISENCLESNLGEAITVNADGGILKMKFPQPDIELVRVERKSPNWPVTRLTGGRKIEYSGPNKLVRCSVEDLIVDGPVVEIGASLARPTDREEYAKCLFIGGSGTHDRHGFTADLDLGYHHYLDRLASRGITSLRFDKRGAATTDFGQDTLDLGFESLVADAQACYEHLNSLTEIASLPSIVIGHSLGGILAMRIALSEPDVQGVILLSCPGRTLDEIIREQLVAHARTLKLSDKSVSQQLSNLDDFFRAVHDEEKWETSNVTPQIMSLVKRRRYYAELLSQSPTRLVQQLSCPVLIIHGELDEQVSVRDSKLLFESAIQTNNHVERKIINAVDHLFKRPKSEARFSSYEDRRLKPSGKVVHEIEQWAKQLLIQGEKDVC